MEAGYAVERPSADSPYGMPRGGGRNQLTREQRESLRRILALPQFPRSARYDVEWLCENEMGPCAAWLAEYLSLVMGLKEGMRVLDLGCGKAVSSVFLAKEFGVEVWATDLWIDPTENHRRVAQQGLEDRVFPIRAEAHALPYAAAFFDAILSFDSYHYYGTDEMYLGYISKFLKADGRIGIVVPGVRTERTADQVERIGPRWEAYNWTFHTPEWWRGLWQRSGCVSVQVADCMPDGHGVWLTWDKGLKTAGVLDRNGDVEMLESDGGNLTFTRLVATKTHATE
jgi:SAM-dependent methyltransferase